MSTAISLSKGQRVDLTKTNPTVSKYKIGLGWDVNASTGNDFDLDASVFALGTNGKLLSNQHFVFFNNKISPDGAIQHGGDNLTGQGDGDDETITVDLSLLTQDADQLVIVVTIHEAEARNQNFGQVRNAFIRIVDDAKNEELLRYDLGEDFSVEAAVTFGRLYKKDGEWKFDAVGAGRKSGLQSYVDEYAAA